MSKKNKNFNKNFSNDAPEIYNMDDIGYMVDEAIHDRATRLEHEKSRLVAMNRDPYLWEVELAYLQREQDLRQTRAALHAEFVKKFVPAAEVDAVLAENSVDEDNGLN